MTTNTSTTNTSTINSKTLAARLETELDDLQKGSRVRLLDSCDVEIFRKLFIEARIEAVKLGIDFSRFEILLDGGAVPNSYNYPGQASQITLYCGQVYVDRTYARKVPHGDNGIARLRVKFLKAEDLDTYTHLCKRFGPSRAGYFAIG